MVLRGVIKDNRYSAEYSEVRMFGKRILRDWIELEKNGRIRGITLIDERANEKPASGGGRGGGREGRDAYLALWELSRVDVG